MHCALISSEMLLQLLPYIIADCDPVPFHHAMSITSYILSGFFRYMLTWCDVCIIINVLIQLPHVINQM